MKLCIHLDLVLLKLFQQTLYNYVDLGLLPIKNIDLPAKLHRNKKSTRVRNNKKKLGTSISDRPNSIENREEFGHWEIDCVLGEKNLIKIRFC